MKKWLLAVLILSCCLLSACGKKKGDTTLTEKAQQSEDIAGTEQVQEEEAVLDKVPEEETVVELPRDSAQMYNDFLDGKEPLYFDYANVAGQYNGSGYDDLFMKDTPYCLGDIFDVIVESSKEYDEDLSIGRSRYAYIDCGQDNEPELAFGFSKISGYSGDIDYDELMIIKAIDNKLQLCFTEEYGYRAYLTLMENGCIKFGGSGGAAYYSNIYKMIDKDGKYVYVYGVGTNYYPVALFMSNYEVVDENEELFDSVMCEEYTFRECAPDEDYEAYCQDTRYVYYALDDYAEPITDDPSYYESDNEYAKVFAQAPYTFVTPDEIDSIVDKRLKEVGVTKEMFELPEVEWTYINSEDEPIDVEDGDFITVPTYTIDNPSWEYIKLTDAQPSDKTLKLTKISQQPNDITDDAEWFDEIGIMMPDRRNFSDQSFEYSLTGEEPYYPYKADVIDLGSYHTIAQLDFSKHRFPDNSLPSDAAFTVESVRYMKSDGFTLYVSVSHSTYAESAPHNAYIMALDMRNDYKVLWKSQPLVANADNFEIVDDFIICGYGFTAEDDYLYILDKYTGEVKDRVLVKSGPDYIHEIDDKIYVRTYNTNYVFEYSVE